MQHKNLCIALLVMLTVNLTRPIHAQFIEVDIQLHTRIAMRVIPPQERRAANIVKGERGIKLDDGTLLPETFLWLEISSTENLELLMDTRGEQPLYYINTGVFELEHAVSFNASTALRLSRGERYNATSRMFKAWIGIMPGDAGPINISYN